MREDEERLLESILKAGDKERAAVMKKHTAELAKAEKRKAEVDRLFAKMYEDRVSERITEYNFNMLSQKYQMEQLELDEKLQKLQKMAEVQIAAVIVIVNCRGSYGNQISGAQMLEEKYGAKVNSLLTDEDISAAVKKGIVI